MSLPESPPLKELRIRKTLGPQYTPTMRNSQLNAARPCAGGGFLACSSRVKRSAGKAKRLAEGAKQVPDAG